MMMPPSQMTLRLRRLDQHHNRHSPASENDSKKNKEHHHYHHRAKKWNQSRRFMFGFGAIMGVLVAWYFAVSGDFNFESLTDTLSEMNLDSLSDLIDDAKTKLPGGILKEASELNKKNRDLVKKAAFAAGHDLLNQGYKRDLPVVMVPGVISTGLENWSLDTAVNCSGEGYFRKRLWGGWTMIKAMILDKNCWLKHIMLNPITGLDPENVRIRAATGFEAADFFMWGYWIWNKIVENLAVLSYDPNTMLSASYDWRLAYSDIEIRDEYFTMVKEWIERKKRLSGKKSVLVSHSMGSQVVFWFFHWVQNNTRDYSWVENHIDSWIDISGSLLGTPKALVALLSGEMKDTVQLNALAIMGLEKFFSRAERALMLRTFPGIATMFPKGGNLVWGNLTNAPDDESNLTYGSFIRFRNTKSILSSKNLTMEESIDYLFHQSPEWFELKTRKHNSWGVANSIDELKDNINNQAKWINPLEIPLPNAPNLKIYNFYGIGKPTERCYYYREEDDKDIVHLNVSIAINEPNPVLMAQGDGTISLLTHSICHMWKIKNHPLNPGNSKITIVEMMHEPDRFDPRGGPRTADHVDILGRYELNQFILMIAAGKGNQIHDRILSNITNYVDNIHLPFL